MVVARGFLGAGPQGLYFQSCLKSAHVFHFQDVFMGL